LSRRGNDHNNAVPERFFTTFKKPLPDRKLASTCDEAKVAVFNFTQLFYNPAKRSGHTAGLSPAELKKTFFIAQEVPGESLGRPNSMAKLLDHYPT
jgi:putative transposase